MTPRQKTALSRPCHASGARDRDCYRRADHPWSTTLTVDWVTTHPGGPPVWSWHASVALLDPGGARRIPRPEWSPEQVRHARALIYRLLDGIGQGAGIAGDGPDSIGYHRSLTADELAAVEDPARVIAG